jgi:hypothetical protein
MPFLIIEDWKLMQALTTIASSPSPLITTNLPKRFHRGARFQILPAYTQDGVIHFRVYEGSTDTRVFEDFIEELLPYCGKWPIISPLGENTAVVRRRGSDPTLPTIWRLFGGSQEMNRSGV